MKKNFTKEEMLNILDCPKDILISDEIIEHSRWSVLHNIIFKYENKFWETQYSVGATENQDERPWEYDEVVECCEVRPVEKIIIVYEEVKD